MEKESVALAKVGLMLYNKFVFLIQKIERSNQTYDLFKRS